MTYESSDVETDPSDSTAISDIPRCIQEKHKMIVTMYDVQRSIVMPLATEIPCWWCRHEFTTPPLGAPIQYHPSCSNSTLTVKKYFKELNIPSDATDFFETVGIFCMEPCIKAYIISQPFNDRFKNALTLLTLLHSKITRTETCTHIPKAPDWRLLERYGGHLSIDEFRGSYPRFTYRMTVNMKRPFMFPTGTYYEQTERIVV